MLRSLPHVVQQAVALRLSEAPQKSRTEVALALGLASDEGGVIDSAYAAYQDPAHALPLPLYFTVTRRAGAHISLRAEDETAQQELNSAYFGPRMQVALLSSSACAVLAALPPIQPAPDQAYFDEEVVYSRTTYVVRRYHEHMEIYEAGDEVLRVAWLLNNEGVRALLSAYQKGQEDGILRGHLEKQHQLRQVLGIRECRGECCTDRG